MKTKDEYIFIDIVEDRQSSIRLYNAKYPGIYLMFWRHLGSFCSPYIDSFPSHFDKIKIEFDYSLVDGHFNRTLSFYYKGCLRSSFRIAITPECIKNFRELMIKYNMIVEVE